ncbi:MAG TPA: hypothetical protein PKC32_12190, partial [Sphingopyxis sp.]|nr:hypothetical protein [Sphingopyxis sp.]
AAQHRIETAVCQLTASSRPLVSCEIDSSLPQGMVMACELAGKAVLLRDGMSPESVRQIRHDMPRLFSEVSARIASPLDSIVGNVIASLPDYVAVRYDAPPMTIADAQDLFRKAMFIVADFLRRTNHDQAYWREVTAGKLPARVIP